MLPVTAPGYEENLALIQTVFGDNSRAISTLIGLLQAPHISRLYGPAPITPRLLGSIRSGTRCPAIQLFKNCATISSRNWCSPAAFSLG
jgi:hypothetical protein